MERDFSEERRRVTPCAGERTSSPLLTANQLRFFGWHATCARGNHRPQLCSLKRNIFLFLFGVFCHASLDAAVDIDGDTLSTRLLIVVAAPAADLPSPVLMRETARLSPVQQHHPPFSCLYSFLLCFPLRFLPPGTSPSPNLAKQHENISIRGAPIHACPPTIFYFQS